MSELLELCEVDRRLAVDVMQWRVKPEYWQPTRSISQAFQVEDRIAELGLKKEYSRVLQQIILDTGTSYDHEFDLIHASPEQRCRASLQCVKEKAKAVGG